MIFAKTTARIKDLSLYEPLIDLISQSSLTNSKSSEKDYKSLHRPFFSGGAILELLLSSSNRFDEQNFFSVYLLRLGQRTILANYTDLICLPKFLAQSLQYLKKVSRLNSDKYDSELLLKHFYAPEKRSSSVAKGGGGIGLAGARQHSQGNLARVGGGEGEGEGAGAGEVEHYTFLRRGDGEGVGVGEGEGIGNVDFNS